MTEQKAAGAALSGGGLIAAGGFRPQQYLGRGVFGRVRVYTNEETGQSVAVKILGKSERFGSVHGTSLRSQVEREVAVLQYLKDKGCDPHILCFIELDEDDDYYYIVTEYSNQYVSLDAWLALSTSSAKDFTAIASSLLDALIYLHQPSVGAVHADLKPENVLVNVNVDASVGGKGAVVKLIDFGLSCIKEFCDAGSAFYRPLEQLRRLGIEFGESYDQDYGHVDLDVDRKQQQQKLLPILVDEQGLPRRWTAELGYAADNWAAGVLLLQMLTRMQFFKTVFAGKSKTEGASSYMHRLLSKQYEGEGKKRWHFEAYLPPDLLKTDNANANVNVIAAARILLQFDPDRRSLKDAKAALSNPVEPKMAPASASQFMI